MGSWLSRRPKNESNLSGKIVIITGGSRGIGLETARQLYELGATVYIGVRTEGKATHAIMQIQAAVSESVGQLKWFPLDLSTIRGSRKSAEGFLNMENRLDILVNNAAIADLPFELNQDGIESTMGTNHFGHFVFTLTLLELMKKTSKQAGADVRIVNVSSRAHGFPKQVSFAQTSDLTKPFPAEKPDAWFNIITRYGRSKLSNILFANELQHRLDIEGYNIIVLSLHPGTVGTDSAVTLVAKMPIVGLVVRFFSGYMFAGIADGAYTSVFAAANPVVRAKPDAYKGKYLVPFGRVTAPAPLAHDGELAKQLWTLSEKVVAANGRP